MDSSFRNDSLSSDQSEHLAGGQQPHGPHGRPPRPHKRRTAAESAAATAASMLGQSSLQVRRPRRGGGGSSSEEEVRSTPDYTSGGDDMESESISEIGEFVASAIFFTFLPAPF